MTFRYGFETDLLKLVGTDELQFMIGSGEETILGRSQGLPVRYVMRWYRKFPAVLFAKASQGIKSLADLAGKKVGVPGLFGANYVGWEALVYAGKLDPQTVTLQSIGFTQATAVKQDQVDAAMDYIVNGPVQLRLAGEEVTVIPVSDFIDLPSNGIITNDKTIKEKPELVQALVTAALRGLADTLADPDAAFEISLKAVPEAGGDQAKVSRAIFDESLKLWQAPAAELGRSDPAAWEKAATFMKEMGLIQNEVNPNDLYTNDFVVVSSDAADPRSRRSPHDLRRPRPGGLSRAGRHVAGGEPKGSSWRSSGPRAAARAPCCACWRACCSPSPARCASAGSR